MKKENRKVYGIIYLIRNKINNKIYIGQTTNTFEIRYGNNLEKYTTNEHLKNAIYKYGLENFEIEKEFDIAYSKEELDKLEDMYIKIYDTTNRKFGYNKQSGGSYGKHLKETKNKISEKTKGKRKGSENTNSKKVVCLNTDKMFSCRREAGEYYNIKTYTGITSCCLSKYKSAGKHPITGESLTWAYEEDYIKMTKEEIQNKIIEANKGKIGSNNPMYGKKFSEESKRKLSKSHKGKSMGKCNPLSKKVICLTTNKIFDCLREACDFYNINSIPNMTNCCQGKLKHCGRHPITRELLEWMYYDEYIKQKLIHNENLGQAI